MPVTAESYIPQSILKIMKRKAWTAWAFGLAVVLLWVSAIVSAPVAAAYGTQASAGSVYSFFSYICHQIPDRSFHLNGHALAVCSRCFGVYFGLLAGFLIYPLFREIDETEPLPRLWLFLSLVPIAVDWSLGVFGIWENTHLSRFATGALLGAACAVFIVPAIVELAQLLSRSAKVKKAVS